MISLIVTYIDIDNKEYHNVYDNSLNCRFPRNLREENKMYIVPMENVTLLQTKTGTYYYSVSIKNIRTIQEDYSHIIQYIESECVICMENKKLNLYIPCGHVCVCLECDKKLKNRICPICRSNISHTEYK